MIRTRVRRVFVVCCLLVFCNLFGITAVTAVSREAKSPVVAVEQYMQSRLDCMVKQDSTLISSYFDPTNPQSRVVLEYEQGRIEIWLLAWNNYGTNATWFSQEFDVRLIEQEGNTARVYARFLGDMKQEDTGDRLHKWGDEPHSITLELSGLGNWVIVADDYIDDFVMQYGRDVNFTQLSESLLQQYDSEKQLALTSTPFQIPELPDASWTTVMLDREAAKNYALTYTNDSRGSDTGSYNNSIFPPNVGADCQNYVSQCYWKGFGGQDSEVENRAYPMIREPASARWYHSNNNGTSSSWISCSAFYDLITNNSNRPGVEGYDCTIAIVQLADYVYDKGLGHVYIITQCDGSLGSRTFSDVYVSAHTRNRKNSRLSNVYPSGGNLTFVKVPLFKYLEPVVSSD